MGSVVEVFWWLVAFIPPAWLPAFMCVRHERNRARAEKEAPPPPSPEPALQVSDDRPERHGQAKVYSFAARAAASSRGR